MKKLLLSFLMLAILLSSGCSKVNNSPISETGIYFDTVITIKLYDTDDKSIITKCFNKCSDYENIFSKMKESSELYKLNHGQLEKVSENDTDITYEISSDLSKLISVGLEYGDKTNGSFDITIEPLTSLWNFHSNENEELKVPNKKDISDATAKINYKNVSVKGNQVTLYRNNTKDCWPTIDLGALAKGYIADNLSDIIKDNGCESAVIDLGGNILCVGEKSEDTSFTIGIQKPFSQSGESVATINCNNLSVVTSGTYERYFKENGKLYHHILNPATGYPFDNGLCSVTILSSSSLECDALSTACFSLGTDDGLKLINSLDNVEAIFITDDDEIHYSDNAKDYIK